MIFSFNRIFWIWRKRCIFAKLRSRPLRTLFRSWSSMSWCGIVRWVNLFNISWFEPRLLSWITERLFLLFYPFGRRIQIRKLIKFFGSKRNTFDELVLTFISRFVPQRSTSWMRSRLESAHLSRHELPDVA